MVVLRPYTRFWCWVARVSVWRVRAVVTCVYCGSRVRNPLAPPLTERPRCIMDGSCNAPQRAMLGKL